MRSRSSRGTARAVRSAIAVAVLTVLVGPAVPAAATLAQGAGPPRLTLVEQPVVVAPDGQFGVFLSFEGAPTAATIAVDIYDRAEAGDDLGVPPDEDPEATFGPQPVIGVDAAGSGTAAFAIQLYADGQPNPDPSWGWEIDEPGVYPVRVRLRDAAGDLTTLVTSLLRLPGPGQAIAQTQASVLVEVHRPPPDDPADRATRATADATLDEQLDPVLAALGARPQLPATFAVTPDTVARMANDPEAATTLAGLRTELGRNGRTLLDAPYVDVDAASLVNAGLADELTSQRDLGRQTLAELLEPPQQGVWQLHDRVDEATLRELRQRGITRTVLPDEAVAAGAGDRGPVTLDADGGSTLALTTSPKLSIGAAGDGDAVLGAHQLLAELALTATATAPEEPGAPRVVRIDPAIATADATGLVLDALAFGTPFFAAAPLGDAWSSRATAAATEVPRLPDLGDWPAALLRGEADLASYRSMVAGQTELVLPFERTLATSAAADLALDQRTLDAGSVSIDLQEPFSAISIPAKDKVTLGAEDATFPLVITSDLDYPVQVVVELASNDRLEFPSNRIEVTVDSPREVVNIKVRTRASGDTPVRISVRTPDDGVALAESSYTIRSTAVSGVGVILTIGAALFLALWWGRHWHRSRDQARHARRRRRTRAKVPPDEPDDVPVDLDV